MVRRKGARLAPDERRRQLLELGLRAFTARPYDDVSIDEIAAEAGISSGLLFHYFPTKHDYYVAALEVAAAELMRVAIDEVKGEPDVRLALGLEAYFRFVEVRAATYAALLRSGSHPEVRRVVEATRRRFVERIRHDAGPLAAGVEPRLLRASLRAWIGFVEALALDWIDHRDLERSQLVAIAMQAIGVALPL